ncbi:hypothetical protein [Cohnella caldifontis]|uniref:hypothetical protein n=1 Tax=Cohnella caldifontis TaxID=3027471 RepID=UPI0023EDDA18|nr:hypothetical protein [Cohnella sp. YIM B05605]
MLHSKGNVRNFLDCQTEDGYIPMMVATLDRNSDLPEPYLIQKCKEGFITNMRKPFLCQQSGQTADVRLLAEVSSGSRRIWISG